MKGALSRADLIDVLAEHGDVAMADAAEALGLERRTPETEAVLAPPDVSAVPPAIEKEPTGFLRVVSAAFHGDAVSPQSAQASVDALSAAELSGSGPHMSMRPPPTSDLELWSRLVGPLMTALTVDRGGGSVDVERLVDRAARQEVLSDLPRNDMRTLTEPVWLILDRSDHLVPIWKDQERLVERLRSYLGSAYVRVAVLANGPTRSTDFRSIRAGDTVLALTDLGMFAGRLARAAWLALGRRLAGKQVRACALTPVVLASRFGRWSTLYWGPCTVVAGAPMRRGQSGVASILARLAYATNFAPGLLRSVRLLCGPSSTDPASELEAWLHPEVERCMLSAAIRPSALPLHRKAFSALRDSEQRAVIDVQRLWRRHQPPEIWHLEVLTLMADGFSALLSDEDKTKAERFASRLHATAKTGLTEPTRHALMGWFLRATDAHGTPKLYQQDNAVSHALTNTWHLLTKTHPNAEVPAGLDLSRIDAESGAHPTGYVLANVERALVFARRDDVASASLLANIEAVRPIALVRRLNQGGGRSTTTETVAPGEAVPIDLNTRLSIQTDRATLVVERVERGKWDQMGRDEFGLWASFEVDGVRHRMRWISPGRFWMGSPDDEPGRYRDEGPRHPVILTQGFWLGETPCTQALWEAVLGTAANRSRFRSPSRPVDRVNIEDVDRFMKALQRRTTGVHARFRLPSEAEWEYACRAGTEAATYAGSIDIEGENNAPVLDAIAWYGGNSGVDYDQPEDGHDTSEWKEQQFQHRRAGTRNVKTKLPNSWGLFDMLGNVHEWCLDGSLGHSPDPYPYPPSSRTNPVADPQRPSRVGRGGSWRARAWNVRAADRTAHRREARLAGLGFRLVRVDLD